MERENRCVDRQLGYDPRDKYDTCTLRVLVQQYSIVLYTAVRLVRLIGLLFCSVHGREEGRKTGGSALLLSIQKLSVCFIFFFFLSCPCRIC